ncbi:MAG: ATP synthase F1 subunit delta [Bacteroidia bacterium]|nr:ATP synthase F1 subunit delta [Bacteroidia bacterium]
MSPRTVAQRYAKALFDLALRQGQVDQLYAELDQLLRLYQESRLFRTIVESPIHRSQQKIGWLRSVLEPAISPLLWTFIQLLIRRGREALLNETCEAFIELYDAYQRRLRAVVRTAHSLSDTARALLSERLRAVFSAETVLLSEEVDPRLIGGFIVEVGTRAADLSVRGRLGDIQKKLLQA